MSDPARSFRRATGCGGGLRRRGLLLLAAGLPAACALPCPPDRGDVLPVTLHRGLPLVPVEVNGNRVPFLFDTGATHSVLKLQGALALRLAADGARTSGFQGAGGVSLERNALVPRLRDGRRELRNLTMPVVRVGPELPSFGIVGADLLRLFEVEIDMPGRRVVLHERAGCTPAPPEAAGDGLPVVVTGEGHVLLDVEVNGMPLRALLDTGADSSVLTMAAARQTGLAEAVLGAPPAGRMRGIGGGATEVRHVRLETLRIGAETLANVRVLAMVGEEAMPFGMILGQDYIGARRFWLSYARRRLHVRDAPRDRPALPKEP